MKSWKRLLPVLAVLLVVFGITLGEILSNAGKLAISAEHKLPSWPKETVHRLARMPVQEDGRVKPFETMAAYRLLRFHGTRTLRLKFDDGSKRVLQPTEWMLDVLFFPEKARHYPLFVVDDPSAVSLVGITPHASRRQRYSFTEIEPALPRLRELFAEFSKIDEKQRQPQQSMIVHLAQNAVEFESLLGTLDWARHGIQPGGGAEPPPLVAAVMKDGKLPLSAFAGVLRQSGAALGFDDVPQPIRDMAVRSQWLVPYPQPDPQKTEWMSLGHMIIAGLIAPSMQETAEKALAEWETLAAQRSEPAAFTATLDRIVTANEAAATTRGQKWRVPWEIVYNRADFFYYTLQLFVYAFLAQAITWLLAPGSAGARFLHASTWVLMSIGLVLLLGGMMVRSIIMDRWVTSVVTNLYETILFNTAFVVFLGLVAEWITRKKLALPITAALAAIGMFLAMKHDTGKATDTLEPLQAVLNTNFWLSIHVTTINIGYAAGLLASGFAAVSLIARLFDPARRDAAFYKTVTACTYGLVCFGLLFSLVGTILGGLWANDSWGRFWGWDPKENGALMIVLGNLVILHARLGGYIKEFGIAMLSLLNGAVIAFSWWHVNLLGVGLHSYGFTSGVKEVVFLFYYAVLAIAALGVVAWLRHRWYREDQAAGKTPRPDDDTPAPSTTETRLPA
ncbi:MAG: cytochrome c biogenesis protein [Verrucomicrobiales bacterium]